MKLTSWIKEAKRKNQERKESKAAHSLVKILPEDSAENEKLIEVKDHKALAKLLKLFPELSKAGKTGSASVSALKAVIPLSGLSTVALTAEKSLALSSAISSLAFLASLIVGEYYLGKINQSLSEMEISLRHIEDFQRSEYQAKIMTLLLETKTLADAEEETLHDTELRNHAIARLENLQSEALTLFFQAGEILSASALQSLDSLKDYEKEITYLASYSKAEEILLSLLDALSDMLYLYWLGKVSYPQAKSEYQACLRKYQQSLASLKNWNNHEISILKIDKENGRAGRTGLDKLFHLIPSLFDKEAKYQHLAEKTLSFYHEQAQREKDSKAREDLFNQDVILVSKDGKIYYQR